MAVGDIEGVYVSTDRLVALEAHARDLTFVQKARTHQQLAGRMQSSMRGRGLTFEELRDYLPGDDIRSIDWRVTARTNKPVVRVYSEEKERPALIIVDQRINMFFGSRLSMKSVAAAEMAMLCAWRILGSGDRVGGFVFNDVDIDEVKPHRSRNAVIAFAGRIAQQNRLLKADAPQASFANQLDAALTSVSNIAKHDHLIVIISDFDGHTAATRDRLLRLSGANDVICILVYDPFLLDLPKTGNIVVSGGALQAELSLRNTGVRTSIADFARDRGRELRDWQQQLGLPMLPVSAAEETVPQLRRLLEQSAWRQRRR
ncbi:DUF58 domain-containing protein [Rhizobium tumorigenes]|uniref:DUF58 domain-containing protein n=1 Tax=Rhizobium tumorigenes TaxID=2041385 RepID=A0AAF1KCR9_9HYPH|nr:DUF58 domain-containing protein [Rhizobium tumorigenes]WFR97576.1 DUF58 domain-containing protein [Rhizobium tumorigenes]WFS03178.1 DUF58 domain-containing protein [Rhizobium tumorigenes]